MAGTQDLTVAAVSTPSGKGGVALIRISGGEARAIADRCFIPRDGRPLSAHPARFAVYGDVLFEGESIDDGVATLFPAPHSYTGEDTVEISCHGGVLITQTVLQAVYAAGAVPATAGEFTRRAFLNGRLSLTEAQAIGNLLEAQSHAQIKLSSYASRTRLAEEIRRIYGALTETASAVYAVIDYPEEDLAEMTPAQIRASLEEVRSSLDRLRRSYRTGHAVSEGIPTAICGKPNAGKSSLYNLLCGGDFAIVTDIAGTTRDVLERTVSLGQVLLRLSDTAGIRETNDQIERIGVERSRRCMEESELILAVFDTSRPLDEDDRRLIAELKDCGKCVIAVLNKADLPPHADGETLRDIFENTVTVSALGDTVQPLSEAVNSLFTDESIGIGTDPVVVSAWQFSQIDRALGLLDSSLSAIVQGHPTEIWASDLELAMTALAELDGRTVNEDIVASIFSHFCVGK